MTQKKSPNIRRNGSDEHYYSLPKLHIARTKKLDLKNQLSIQHPLGNKWFKKKRQQSSSQEDQGLVNAWHSGISEKDC